METFTGKAFYPWALEPEMFDIVDIAHHLSLICRFTGAVRSMYSVAQHCVIGSMYALPEVAYAFLMHDLAEAYLNDVSRPVKVGFPEYGELEDAILTSAAHAFNFSYSLSSFHDDVKAIDNRMLATERRDLMPNTGRSWVHLPQPYARVIQPWSSEMAEDMFLLRFENLAPVHVKSKFLG